MFRYKNDNTFVPVRICAYPLHKGFLCNRKEDMDDSVRLLLLMMYDCGDGEQQQFFDCSCYSAYFSFERCLF